MNRSPDAPEPDVYVLLGSNFEPLHNLDAALRLLAGRCRVLAVSSVYRTPAAGGERAPDYLNAVVRLTTPLAPAEFKLSVLRDIEAQLGRERGPDTSKTVVPVDLDIILWGETPITYGDRPWRSPSPDLLRHAFVAVPMAELAPALKHPETGQTLAEIAAGFDADPIERVGALSLR